MIPPDPIPSRGTPRVVVVTRLYPNALDPTHCVFVEEEVRHLAPHADVAVVAPVPWFPRWRVRAKWYAFACVPERETRAGRPVFHPRYPALPWRLGFPAMGAVLARAIMRGPSGSALGACDLIHAHFAFPDGVGAAVVASRLGLPLVVSLHGSDINDYGRNRWLAPQIRWAFRRCSAILAPSQDLVRKAMALGAPSERVHCVPNGFDLLRFAPQDRRAACERLGLDGQRPRVIYVGNFVRVKGLDTLLRAWPEVARRLPDAELVLLGRRGPGYDEVDAEGLAARLDIGTSVRLVERTDNAAVATWLGASDVMVLPSIAEGFGVALVEGLACGLRAVATRSGGGEDIVTSADGRLVPVGDTRALAEALATELTTRASRDREAIAARARSRFAYPEVARRISGVYGAVLGWASGSPATSTAVGTG